MLVVFVVLTLVMFDLPAPVLAFDSFTPTVAFLLSAPVMFVELFLLTSVLFPFVAFVRLALGNDVLGRLRVEFSGEVMFPEDVLAFELDLAGTESEVLPALALPLEFAEIGDALCVEFTPLAGDVLLVPLVSLSAPAFAAAAPGGIVFVVFVLLVGSVVLVMLDALFVPFNMLALPVFRKRSESPLLPVRLLS